MSSYFVYDRLLEESELCNYTAEINELRKHVKAGRCVRLIGRRNFGKTSIIKNVVAKRWEAEKSQRIVIYVDLFAAETLFDISAEFTKAINLAMSRKRSLMDKGVEWLKGLRQVRPTWTPPSTSEGLGEFSIKAENGDRIVDFQVILENVASLQRKGRFEFFLILDEFQEIAQIKQAAPRLRESLQNLGKDIPVVILGSKQHMLTKIFAKPTAPFSSWGAVVDLKPIPYASYHKYILERFTHAQKYVDAGTTTYIQDTLDRIPECINRFCDFLVGQPALTNISRADVDAMLQKFLDSITSIYSAQYAAFTPSQRLVLKALASRGRTAHALGSDFMGRVGGVSKSGVEKILARFLDDAVVYRELASVGENLEYIVADPLFRMYIAKYKNFD